jgi:hypothetical protein
MNSPARHSPNHTTWSQFVDDLAMSTLALPQRHLATLSDGSEPAFHIQQLMHRYCDVIDQCDSIPKLSMLPGFVSYVKMLGWTICLDLCLFIAPINVALIISHVIFRHRRFILGATMYTYLARPFVRIWQGELPGFKIASVRYLTTMLLFYYAQYRITALNNAFNRLHFDILATQPASADELAKADKMQKSFELFQKILQNTYQFRVFVLGGPLIAILSALATYAIIPLAIYLLKIVWHLFTVRQNPTPDDDSFMWSIAFNIVIFVACLIWVISSAWMDMRSILVRLDVPDFERRAFAAFRIVHRPPLPIDVIGYFTVITLLYSTLLAPFAFTWIQHPEAFAHRGDPFVIVVNFAIQLCFLLVAGLVVADRRHRLAGRTAVSGACVNTQLQTSAIQKP